MSHIDYNVSLPCRDLRHGWERSNDLILIKDSRGNVRHFQRVLVCFRCGTERTDEYLMTATSLQKLRSGYRYPKGYQIPGGANLEKLRMELFQKMNFVEAEDVDDEDSSSVEKDRP